MRRNYVELQQFLQIHFPELREPGAIEGKLYDPPLWTVALAQGGQILQMCGLVLTLGGDFLFNRLGLPAPPFQPFINAHRVPVMIGLFFANSIASSFMATGAFEISLDGEIIFSKLKEGTFPTGMDVVKALNMRGFSGA
ncbi:unnamed protein product [Choristocarpus tenellus]